MCDRTSEFLQCTGQGKSLNKPKPKSINNEVKTRTAFHDAASEIAKGIHRASGALQKLTKLVQRQGLFDDPTQEINNLVVRIKQDLEELNSKCDSAQQYVDSKKRSLGDKNQSADHNVKVVSHLKTDLMHATKDFKTVLEIRSVKMKDQQIRKQELTGKGTLSPMRQFNASQQGGQGVQQIQNQQLGLTKRAIGSAVEPNQGARIIPSPYNQNFETAYPHSNDESGMPLLDRQQGLLLAPPQASQYYEAREEAVTEVEKTINELGTLFKRLATMISEQQELVERIDDDIESSVNNAERAKSVLMKAYEQAVSNRGLTTKLAAILGGFILFFILFLM